ncbi:phage antirepressor KilAC domain-containing protein [Bacillus velezensis]|uniref:Phage antirepressor KilAC domain-containing protein n=1 Tax=Bacillus subtilis TaxID=1423 RepID=A0A8I1WLJ8_BACIU|nr:MULTISPECIES: phage antirepressor KilAC domain-containing protein [Bacillus subtilis group]MBO3797140.1 phage antirepressor KilAC domain-containing protein [Bacillus subtilis]MCV4327033.1 phage antirepressor KilAC domain-containing protein [Bacillus velezensis]NRG14319.1 phage antirepressor KilAC domain-containing protein [Bacillus velezensis]
MNNNLTVVEQDGQRVLTTAQLAEAYGADEKLIQQNFNNNKTRYKEEKHFILLHGDGLRAFKRDFENLGIAPNINKLYLWTEKGALLHAKSLNTDQAWDAYEMLVDDYYKIKKQLISQTVPSYMIDNSIDRAKRWIEERMELEMIEQSRVRLANQVLEDRPKVEKYHQFLDADGLMDIGSLAKELNIKGFGRNKLFTFLKDQKILMANNLPYQKYMGRGLFEVKSVPTSKIGYVSKTYLTPKGADYIADLIRKTAS